MKSVILNKYTITAILLFAAAAVFMSIALFSIPGEITTALVISASVCVMTGIFTLTFSGGEPVDQHLVGILPVQGCITLCRITHHLGMHGNAYFLPQRITGENGIMQFNPVSTYDGKEGSEKKGLFRENGPAGLVTNPSSDLLIEDLRKRNALVIPGNEEHLTRLIREIIEDIFKCAPRVSVQWAGSSVTITFHNYTYIDGCKIIEQKSPLCCATSPCPVCSLCGVVIAEGLDKVVTLDRCSISPSSSDITTVFSILPSRDSPNP